MPTEKTLMMVSLQILNSTKSGQHLIFQITEALSDTSIKLPFIIVVDRIFSLKNYILRLFPGSQFPDNFIKRIFNYHVREEL